MSRIIIQSDWDDALRRSGGKCWVSFRQYEDLQSSNCTEAIGEENRLNQEAAHSSEHAEVLCRGQLTSLQQTQSLPYDLTTTSPCFTVIPKSQKTIEVSYSSGLSNGSNLHQHTCTFVPPKKTFQHFGKNANVSCCDVSSGGIGVSCSGSKLLVWDSDTGEIRRELSGHVSDIYSCKLFPSGVVVLSSGADMTLRIWSAQDGSCPRILRGHTRGVNESYMIGSGRRVVSVSSDGTARLWDCGDGRCVDTLYTTSRHTHQLPVPINTCHATAIGDGSVAKAQMEGKMLCLGCDDGTVRAVDMTSRDEVLSAMVTSASGRDSVTKVLFLPANDNLVVAGTHSGSLHTYDIRNPSSPVNVCHLHRGSIHCITAATAATTPLVFISTGDGSCVGRSVQQLSGVSGSRCAELELTGADCDPVTAVAWPASSASPAAHQHLYTTCRDGQLRVYDTSHILPDG